VLGRELGHAGAMNNEHALSRRDEPFGVLPRSSVECGRKVIAGTDVLDLQRHAQRTGRLAHCLHL
jgi:hypothetical protein